MSLTDSARPGGANDASVRRRPAPVTHQRQRLDDPAHELTNAMLIVAVALVVAVILAVVAVLALRYTVLAAVETDLAQIAVLKAIGRH